MLNVIIRDIIIFAFAVLLSFLIDFKKSINYWYALLLFFVIGFIDNLFYTLTMTYPGSQLIKTHIWNNNLVFNWSSKLYSIIFAIILLTPLNKIITADEIGLRFKQNENSIRFSLFFILLFFIISTIIGLLSEKEYFDINTLFYAAIMPGLNEELIYRGFLLGFLNKIFARNFKILNTNFGWGAILTSIVFGLLHGFKLSDNYMIHFDFIAILISCIYGFIFALIKERSGSLVFPVIAHSTTDFFNFFFRMI